MGLEILDGRAFSKTFPTDVKEAYIVNQEAVRLMGLESPVGERLSVFREEGRIIGVVKDFHFQPFYASIQPFVFILRPQNPDLLLVRMRPGGTSAALQTIERVYKQFESDYPFRFRFFNDYLRRNIYSIEHRIGRIAGWFTLLAVLIACLGLFGLASFVTERRNKEIGIRKVMGASAMGVIFMLCKAFIKWVLIANLLAWPTAYFLMQKHLQRYAYRIDLGLDVFLVSGTAAVLIAVLTVSSQAFRAARKNPVDTLRYE